MSASEAEGVPSRRERLIGQILCRMGAATQDDVLAAVEEQVRQTKTGNPVWALGRILVARAAVSTTEINRALAIQARIPETVEV